MVQQIVTIILIAVVVFLVFGLVFTFFFLPGDYKK